MCRTRKILSVTMLLGLMTLALSQKVYADANPPGCGASGVSLKLAIFFNDGVTPVGSSVVAPCETLKIVATVSSVANTCCIDGTGAGFLEIVDPDGVHHVVGSGAAIGLLCDGASFTGSTLTFTFANASAGPKTFTAHFSGIAHETTVDTPGSADSSLPKTVTVGTCDDGNPCTLEHCDSALVYGPVTGTERLGGCVSDGPLNCDDGNACTLDGCDPASGCTHSAISCDDGNACTLDGCDPASGCTHSAISCDDGNACTLDGCDPASGCTHSAISCDDNDVCTTDTCDPVLGCQHTDNGQCACVTRTQGYWFNHIIAPKGINPAGCATLSAVFAQLGTINLGFTTVNLDQAIGMFWTKGPSTPLCQARQKLATQLIAAVANATLLNTPGTACVRNANDIIAAAQTAAAGCDIAAITAAKSALDAFNNSGDALSFPAGLGACGAGKENKDFIAAHSVAPGASCTTCQ